MVSASALKALINRVANYIGYVSDEATLQNLSPTMDAFALVGNPIAIWVFDVETNEWSKPASDGNASSFESSMVFNTVTDLLDRYADAITINRIEKSSEITSVAYSTNGGANYNTIIFPFTTSFSLLAGTEIIWQITYAAEAYRGVLNIIGTKI